MNLPYPLAPIGCISTSAPPCSSAADSALGLPRQRLLASALSRVRSGTESTHDLRLDLPPSGEVRIRNLVHRGAPRPVFKLTSVKLGRVVQCESALEHEAIVLLDAAPAVQSFAEQPVRIRYRTAEAWHSHIPDFATLVADRLTFVEIKFTKDIDAEVHQRTRLLETRLQTLNAGYCLLTERHLRQGHHVQNAVRVLRRARHAISQVQLLATLEKLRALGRVPLSAFGWSVAESNEAVGIAQLIISGHAEIDGREPLSDRACVWLASDAARAGGAT